MNRSHFFFAVAAVLAFAVGTRVTDWIFRAWKIPYPFEVFGIAAGLGLACWTIGGVSWLMNRRSP